MSHEQLIGKVLTRFREDPHGSQAARVALRKMRVGTTPPVEAMALAVQHGESIDRPKHEADLLFCALQLAALLADQHAGDARVGQALHDAKVSELRLERLLRARADQLPGQLKAVARQLLSSGTRVDVFGLVRLLWRDDDRPRLQIAQSYYRAAAQGDS